MGATKRTEDDTAPAVFRSPARMLLEGLEGICLLIAVIPTWPLLKRLLDNLGAWPEERASGWPGDELLEWVDDGHTRAIGIDAAAASVWPWLHQFGLDRGGFFSYELLERLAGWKVKNIERLRPDLVPLRLDDGVVLNPGEPAIWLSLIEKNRHLCFRSWRDDSFVVDRDPPTLGSWSFYLVPAGDESCRLLLRTCKQRRRSASVLARAAAWLVEDPLDLVMEQRTLRTLRRLAEAYA